MDNRRIANELMKVARLVEGVDFSTEEELKNYLKEHPGADRKKHRVVKKENLKKRHQEIEDKRNTHSKKKVRTNTIKKVKNVMSANGLKEDSDEMQELAGFKSTLGQRVPSKDVGKWYVRNVAKLKRDFLARMDPRNYSSHDAFQSAKNRIQKMDNSDFAKVLAAVNDDEEDEQ